MLQSDRIFTTPHAVGVELARRQARALRCGFSAGSMRQLVSHTGGTGPAWSIGAHRETDRAKGAKAFPFRIAAVAAT
ncbi:hypothetical protein IAG32_13970 [Achromobacter xylosoxidans]|uniref:Uncharacterized protein n=1 Tax=Alcaligenes xylosoxydans xylosoxydans TaxID=85698 RepID=A0A424WG82_ALCXX|nr:hypothetical protein [Achromobacter xylosoxidans]MBD0869098.1 hypothetical protein [Achromobacter xylosoxidans]QNP84088.1 hypothetical protein IAG39_21475 [Achromobacter xylosoxidans]RPJ92296.1 hypothetical protein DY367_08720 [Achromobacter xylosoxidans]